MSINAKILRDAKWKSVYRYIGATISFEVFACDAIPDLTITHNKRGSKRTPSTYTVFGKKTDSPIQAIRIYNYEEKVRAGARPEAAGSPESLKQRKIS